MYESVRAAYVDFTATSELEGAVEHMYLDVKGLVTVGIGTLIEAPDGRMMDKALSIQFFFRGQPDQLATHDDIRADFHAVNSMAPGLGKQAYQDRTKLDISNDEMARLVLEMLDSLATELRKTPEFSDLDLWPADAQMALLSMAYPLGGAFAQGGRYPNFRAAVDAWDFVAAAHESHISEENNPNMRARNWANELMFVYADRVHKLGLPYDTPIFPNVLRSDGTVLDMGLAPRQAIWPTLKLGTTGRQVEVLQALLGMSPTGTFDEGTDVAVRAFQATAVDRNGQPLTADGIVGLQTWRALVLR
ncbi:peptidoglycan-binding domain-containing protein [Nannocystis pusilla]|uniref:Peptidoglycan-binding domain-containing protein n=1 Tax=Nannocystis pusilla TaxID=889268 RepID=A0A9X3IV26_9BACT|nr:peptidoglycan-binding domain-containing protein [Nannocystis pusilla]MCY1004465.1 peptidoglycan-binding domain-containing protein [Nannocystis pusilla]